MWKRTNNVMKWQRRNNKAHDVKNIKVIRNKKYDQCFKYLRIINSCKLRNREILTSKKWEPKINSSTIDVELEFESKMALLARVEADVKR